MDQKIIFDNVLRDELKLRTKLKKIADNDASHFIQGNFRSKIFNIKAYLSDKKLKDQILYIPVNVVAMIATGFADFVIGDGVDVEINNDEAQKKRNEIAEANAFNDIIYDMAVDQSVFGYASMRVRKDDDDEILLEQIPFEYYYPELEDLYLGDKPKKIRIVSVKPTGEFTKLSQTEAKVQSYTVQTKDSVLIEYGRYKGDPSGNLELISEYNTPETLDFLNVYTVNNKKTGGKILGTSDFVDCLDLIEEVNDRLTQISVQFIKHLNVKISMPEGIKKLLDEKDVDGKPKYNVNDLDVYVHRQGEEPARYIENNNYLIDDAMKYLDKVLRLICATLQAPPAFLALEENGGAEKVEALKIRLVRFLKKINRKQSKFETMIKKLVKDTLKFAGVKTEVDVEVKFSDKDLRDDQTAFDNYLNMYKEKLLSKKSTIGYLLDRDEEMVDSEMKVIDEETKKNQEEMLKNGIDPNNPNGKSNLNPNNKKDATIPGPGGN